MDKGMDPATPLLEMLKVRDALMRLYMPVERVDEIMDVFIAYGWRPRAFSGEVSDPSNSPPPGSQEDGRA